MSAAAADVGCELIISRKADLDVNRYRSASLIALPGMKVSFFDSAILIVAPIAALRPSRSGVSLTLNLPNEGEWSFQRQPVLHRRSACLFQNDSRS